MVKHTHQEPQDEPPEIPQAITLELLKTTPVNYLDSVVFEYVNKYVFDDPKKFNKALSRLPEGLQYCWLINDINYQILNGGFWQFFFNSSGERALETVEALRAVGAKEQAKILEKAIRIFAKKYGRPANSRERWYGETPNDAEIDALDSRFTELVESGASSIVPYVRKHPELFVHKRRARRK
jgi:hypothetical protein